MLGQVSGGPGQNRAGQGRAAVLGQTRQPGSRAVVKGEMAAQLSVEGPRRNRVLACRAMKQLDQRQNRAEGVAAAEAAAMRVAGQCRTSQAGRGSVR